MWCCYYALLQCVGVNMLSFILFTTQIIVMEVCYTHFFTWLFAFTPYYVDNVLQQAMAFPLNYCINLTKWLKYSDMYDYDPHSPKYINHVICNDTEC